MAIQALQLMATVGADTSGAMMGLQQVEGMARRFLPGGPIGLAFAAGAAAVAGVGIASVKMAGDFEQGMTTLVTGAGEPQKNLQLIRDGILGLANDTGTSTKQLTDGMYMIASAGYHGADGLNVLKAASEGAKVGNADLGTVADATTTLMKDFGIKSGDSAQAVNALIATVANGKTHMQDLAGALAEIAPTAAASKISMNDMLGAMATMTGEGVPAANAATYLRQTIIALDAPTAQAKKAMEAIGLSSAQVAQDMQTKGLPFTLNQITGRLAAVYGQGTPQYMAALKEISGGSKEMQGMLDLTGDHMKDFGRNVGSVSAQVEGGGNQISGWNLVQQTFNQRIAQAKEHVETFMISLGTKLIPVLEKAADWIAKNVVPALQKLGEWIGTHVLPVALQMAQWFETQIVPTLKQFAGFILQNVVPAIGQMWDWFAAKVLPVLQQVAAIVVKNVIPAVEQIWTSIQKNLIPALEHAWNTLGPKIIPIFQFLGAVLKNVVGPAISDFIAIFSKIIDIGTQVADALSTPIKTAINIVIGAINGLIGALDSIQIHIPAVGVGPVHTPAFDWNGLGLGQLPYLASGGTATGAGAALVGERGPELVSLPRGASVIPLPAGLGGGGAGFGGSPQMVQVTTQITLDGLKLAQVVTKHQPTVLRNATGRRAF